MKDAKWWRPDSVSCANGGTWAHGPTVGTQEITVIAGCIYYGDEQKCHYCGASRDDSEDKGNV